MSQLINNVGQDHRMNRMGGRQEVRKGKEREERGLSGVIGSDWTEDEQGSDRTGK